MEIYQSGHTIAFEWQEQVISPSHDHVKVHDLNLLNCIFEPYNWLIEQLISSTHSSYHNSQRDLTN